MTVPNQTSAAPRPAAVYRLYDSDGTLLYIGSAYDPEERCKRHRDKPWWPEVSRRTDEWHSHRGAAYGAEMTAIASEASKYNAMGATGYRTPQTEAVRRRNALASLRQKLVGQAGQVSLDVRAASREAGFSHEQSERMATLAQIEFLEWTGLFARSVKWRREVLELYGC